MTMKKTLLFASALSLVLLAGCTKEQPAATAPGAENKLTISGSIVMPATKIQIGEPADDKASVLWENGDQITLFAANSQNIVPKSSFDMSIGKSVTYYADATATTTSPSTFTYFTYESGLDGDLTNDSYTLYGVCGTLDYYAGFQKSLENGFSLPNFSSQTYGSSSPYFMVASTPLEADQTAADLEFTNTTAVLMLNLSGTAKISKITIQQLDASSMEGTVALAYSGYPPVNFLKVPQAGATAAEFANFVDTSTATSCSTITVNMGSTGLQLTESGVAVPVGVVPFDLKESDMLIVTVYGNSDTFEEKAIACTLRPVNASVTSNSIVYINLAPFSLEDFGQSAPKDDWKVGDVVLNEDFSWVTTAVDWSGSVSGGDDGTDIGGSGAMNYTDLGGWAGSYSNNSFPYYNMLDSYYSGATGLLTKRGYTTMGYAYCLWYENDGMLSSVDEYGSAGPLGYSLSALNNYTGNVTVTFKACRVTEANGDDSWGMMPSQFPVSITGNGTIDGNTSVTLGSPEYAPFTFYEYTLVIENADASTQITFGSMTAGMYLDDIKIVISNEGDTNNLTGTMVAKPVAELKYSEPATGTTVDLPATGAETQTLIFKVNGPWKAIYSDNLGTKSSEVDGINKWAQLSGAQWNIYDEDFDDLYGNMIPTALQISNIKDNTTGKPRTATIEIVSLDETTTYATYNFTQAVE